MNPYRDPPTFIDKRGEVRQMSVPAMPVPTCLHANPWNNCKTCGTKPKKIEPKKEPSP